KRREPPPGEVRTWPVGGVRAIIRLLDSVLRRGSTGTLRADFRDGHGHSARTGLLEIEGQREGLPFAQWLAEAHQHDVLTPWLQADRLTGRDLDPGDRPHFHHRALHRP